MANAGNWINAANSAVNKAIQARRAIADKAVDYSELGRAAIRAEAAEAVDAVKANVAVGDAVLTEATRSKLADIDSDLVNRITDIKKNERKAGMLAAGAGLMGASYLLSNKKIKPDEQLSTINRYIDLQNQRALDAASDISKIESETYVMPERYRNSTKDTTTDNSQGLSNQSTNNVLNLTDNDFKELAYAVSSEAALNTNDEYGVAANILTRLKSGNYGSSIGEIIRAPGQYQGVYQGKSKYSPEIQARLQSPEGQAKILDAIKRLDGRTEFKGQTMLMNRVAKEDPMFHPSGNFYHYSWQ